MALRYNILQKLKGTPNQAVERAVEFALRESAGREQSELVEVLLERNQRAGWVALIRSFHLLEDESREKLLSRPRDLFGPLAESMHDDDGPTRANVISIVQNCADPRLVYLLAEALTDTREEVRQLAGQTLLDTVRRGAELSPAEAAERHVDVEAQDQMQKALDLAMRRYRNHRQSSALLASLIFERRLDSPMWLLFSDTYDEATRAATVALRSPAEPAVVPALLLALGSPLKTAAVAGLTGIEKPALAAAVAANSFRLVDPVLRDAVRALTHLKLLPAVRRSPPWHEGNWMSWLRLIQTTGLQPAERLNWLTRMWETVTPGPESAAWRMHVVKAIADTGMQEAGTILVAALRDPDERVARCTVRCMLGRRTQEWKDLVYAEASRSPHLSVRRMVSHAPPSATVDMPGKMAVNAAPAAATRPSSGFEKAWSDYQKMPPAVQHTTARNLATDPIQVEQLKAKLNAGSPQEVAQGLKMLLALPSLTPFRNQIIILCGHSDPRIVSLAVALLGRLEDPKLKELLEAAMRHTDARVRANAVESMEMLHIADKSQQLLALLNSRHNRERANAIKAIGQFNFATARECLLRMLADPNPLHRLSALWVVGQFDFLNVMRQVALIARRDPNTRVRKQAAEMLETLSGNVPTPS